MLLQCCNPFHVLPCHLTMWEGEVQKRRSDCSAEKRCATKSSPFVTSTSWFNEDGAVEFLRLEQDEYSFLVSVLHTHVRILGI
jgi:hypothetical protein